MSKEWGPPHRTTCAIGSPKFKLISRGYFEFVHVINDGKIWLKDGNNTTSEVPATNGQAEEALMQSFGFMLDPAFGTKLRKLAKEPGIIKGPIVDGRITFGIISSKKNDQYYFWDDNKLLAKLVLDTSQGKRISSNERYFEDYKKVDGLMLPYKMRQFAYVGNERTLIIEETVTEVRFFDKIDDKIFAKP